MPRYADGGEPLVFPAGHPKQGEPITDWQGNPIGHKGIVFYNGTDKVVQAAPADGNAIIIMNQVTLEQAQKLQSFISTQGAHPSAFTLTQTKELLAYARSIGIVDQYNSDQAFKASKFTPVQDQGGYGLFKRDDRDLCQAVIMTTNGAFAGPAGEAQPFAPGDVILMQPDAKSPEGVSARKIDRTAFEQTYMHPDGTPMSISIPHATPEAITSKLSERRENHLLEQAPSILEKQPKP